MFVGFTTPKDMEIYLKDLIYAFYLSKPNPDFKN